MQSKIVEHNNCKTNNYYSDNIQSVALYVNICVGWSNNLCYEVYNIIYLIVTSTACSYELSCEIYGRTSLLSIKLLVNEIVSFTHLHCNLCGRYNFVKYVIIFFRRKTNGKLFRSRRLVLLIFLFGLFRNPIGRMHIIQLIFYSRYVYNKY